MKRYRGLIWGRVLCVARHGTESRSGSGTLLRVRVVQSRKQRAGAQVTVGALVHVDRGCAAGCAFRVHTPRGECGTVCSMHAPLRWNMPEALVAVVGRQSCCSPSV